MSALVLYLPNFILKHLIRLYRVSVLQLLCCFNSHGWDTVLKATTRCRLILAGDWGWERQVVRHQAKLLQHCTLIPPDVLVIKPISTNVDYGNKRDAELAASARNSWRTNTLGNEWSAVFLSQRSRISLHLQPVDGGNMSTLEKELINHSIDTRRATSEGGHNVVWVVKDEVISVECRQLLSASTASKLLQVSMTK